MKYLSTNEIAKKWGVSRKTVNRYASEGRIEGASLVGRTWLIPEDARKDDCVAPINPAVLESTPGDERDVFHFPLYLYRNFFELKSTLKGQDELILYSAFESVLDEDYVSAYVHSNEALSITENLYIKITCLYVMARCSLYECKYSLFMKHVMELNQIFATDFEHKKEMRTLMIDLETYYRGFSSILSANYDATNDYGEELLPIITTIMLYKQIVLSYKNMADIDTTMYEIALKYFTKSGYIYPSIMLGSELALIFYNKKQYVTSYSYAIKAYEMANDYNGFIMLTDLYSTAPKVLDRALQQYGLTINPRLQKMTRYFKHAYIGLMVYLKKPKSLFSFTNDDFDYIYYAIYGYTNKEIAIEKGISENAVSQRYTKLYNSFFVNNKKELISAFINGLDNY